jgi:tRNA(fMet)-specific endonuclease VapC
LMRGLKKSVPANKHEKAKIEVGERILRRCQKAERNGDVLGISAATVAELEFGACSSGDYAKEAAAMEKILTPFQRFTLDASLAPKHYGEIRHALESSGMTIGSMDLLIAAHVMALGAILVTNNTGHFARVTGLRHENWCL